MALYPYFRTAIRYIQPKQRVSYQLTLCCHLASKKSVLYQSNALAYRPIDDQTHTHSLNHILGLDTSPSLPAAFYYRATASHVINANAMQVLSEMMGDRRYIHGGCGTAETWRAVRCVAIGSSLAVGGPGILVS